MNDKHAKDPFADAEEIHDPLDGLAAKTKSNPGAPFAPDVLERLAALKKADHAAFEALREQLKKAGCRVTELDRAIARASGDKGGRRPAQADILIELAQPAELFRDKDDGAAYADLEIDGHRETWPIRSKRFRRWLIRRFFEATQSAPNSEALQSALGAIEAGADNMLERIVHVRVGELDGRLYLDLADKEWRVVEIDADGWRVIGSPPVRFRRSSNMKSLPLPVPGGSIAMLRSFLNVRSDGDFVLAVSFLLAALRFDKSYPVLMLAGPQGAAKSTFSKILRSLLDPYAAPLRPLPREERDLYVTAKSSQLLVFDNVSGLPGWLSDAICRLSTGGGFAVRQLYTDQEEVVFAATRPVIIGGIEDIVTRPDLADRALFLMLESISDESRRSEDELLAAFKAERPRILGVLLDAVAEGLKRLPETRLERLPRMADFALWATACETALWPAGAFEAAYGDNRDEAVETVLDADPVSDSLRKLMATQTEWNGTASELLKALDELAGDRDAKAKSWPGNARALTNRLRRAATFLRKIGIEIVLSREGHARTRMIRITVVRWSMRVVGGTES